MDGSRVVAREWSVGLGRDGRWHVFDREGIEAGSTVGHLAAYAFVEEANRRGWR